MALQKVKKIETEHLHWHNYWKIYRNLKSYIMKTTTLTILILLTFTFGFSQTGYDDFTVDSPKNEFQLNIFNLLIFSALDVNYERIVDDESSFGVSMMFSLNGTDRFKNYNDPYYFEGFNLSPYYRIYFGRKPNAGFFAETFAMYSKGHYDYYFYSNDESCHDCITIDEWYGGSHKIKPFTEFGVGFAVGIKFLTRRHFSISAYGGVARNFLTTHGPSVAPKVGISLGRRW